MIRLNVALMLAATAVVPVASAQNVSVSLLLSSDEHRVNVGSGTFQTSGIIPGALIGIAFNPHVDVQLAARSGTLNASGSPTDDEDVAEVSALVRYSPAGWVSFHVLGRARAVTTTLVRQHWTSAGIGADLRMPLIGSATEGFLRFNVPVVVSVSGLPAPSLSIEGGAGLRYRQGRFLGQLAYGLRRFDFPPAGGRTRLEQISTLTLGAGVLFGH